MHIRLIPCLFLLIVPTLLVAQQRGDSGSTDSPRFSFEAYGEILMQHYDFGPDRKSGATGAPEDSRTIVDLPRVVFEMEYEFPSDWSLTAELEIEHAGTGGAMELEYEEFGEYEQEIERGGEVVLEEVYVTKRFSDHLSLRAGRMVLPVGLLNRDHEPDEFFTAIRPEGESQIIPVTWNEIGLAAFGSIGPVEWQGMIVNGLDAIGFSSENWVAGGHQTKFEVTRATNPAVVLRLDYRPIDPLRIGAALYRGNSTGNRPKEDMEGIDGVVTIVEGDVHLEQGPLILRGEFIEGDLSNASKITSKNNRISRNLTVPRTPVASGARAWGAEIGVDLFDLLDQPGRLIPFVRYDSYNSMARTEGAIFPDPRFDRTTLTAGANWFPIDEVILKADFSHRELGGGAYNDENTVSLGVAFVGELLEL